MTHLNNFNGWHAYLWLVLAIIVGYILGATHRR